MPIHANKGNKKLSQNANQSRGGKTLMPPETWNGTRLPNLGGSIMPLQRQAIATAPVLTDAQMTLALSYNNTPDNYGQGEKVTGGFRVDWVRNMQRSLINAGHLNAETALSNDGSIDRETVLAVARFQGENADGKIGPITREALETAFPRLGSQLIGNYRREDILVPAGSSEEKLYDYFKSIIERDGGGAFASEAMEINMLGIRGVQYDKAGNIVQTGSAEAYHNLYEAGATSGSDHFGWSGKYDDILVSLWIDAQNVKHASVKIGNVDPKDNAGKNLGAAHLRDGQYMYRLDQHTTSSRTHRGTLNELDQGLGGNDRNLLGLNEFESEGKTYNTYSALRANGPIEVYRDGENRFISQTEARNSETNIRERKNTHVNDEFIDINIHIGGQDVAHSAGCQNVRADQYTEHLQEIDNASNKENFHYSLIDASKISHSMNAARVSSNTPEE